MRWFKHYSDMHDGETIAELFEHLGHKGLAFFLLQELCCEKLEKNKDQILQESDCVFRFPVRIVRQKLRLSGANLTELLRICATKGQLSYIFDENIVEIKMPILLYLLDSDSKKARQKRAEAATQSRLDKDKEEDKELDKDKEPKKKKTLPVIPAELAAPKANEFIALYCQAFKARHNADPVIDGRSAGTAKAIVKTLPQDKWHLYLKAFFTMPDAYLFKAKHPLALFQTKLQEIAVFAQSGNFTTQKQASQIDNQSTIESQIKRIQEGQV
jgi:hypothetical protein